MECPECRGQVYLYQEIKLFEDRGIVLVTLNQIGRVMIHKCYECRETFAVMSKEG